MAFFRYGQNNSGGGYHIDDNIGHAVWIEATDHNEANDKASSLGLFSLSYCECCGERFYSCWQYDAEEAWSAQESDSWHRNRYGQTVTVIHFADGKVQREVR